MNSSETISNFPEVFEPVVSQTQPGHLRSLPYSVLCYVWGEPVIGHI